MANRREFLQRCIVGSGVARFSSKSSLFKAALSWLEPTLKADGWELYEVGGQVLFPIYGENGAISVRQICWLIQKSGKGDWGSGWYAIPVEFNPVEGEAIGWDSDAVKNLCAHKLREAIKTVKPIAINLDGGNLPMPSGPSAA